MNPYEMTIAQAGRELRSGHLSARELTGSCLEQIVKSDTHIQSFITVCSEEALAQADEADKLLAEKKGGALCGIPLSIKDLICTKGIKTTCGSRILSDFIPPYDATVITKLKEEGAVILGKVAMDEFAMGSTSETCAFGVPQNPWKAGHVCGGSSGGSASSVAAHQCLGSLGSDTGGSIRQPASLCGVVGLKPTYGSVSRYGLVAFASSLDQIGPLAKDVTDCSILMSAISGHDPKDSTSVNRNYPDHGVSLQDGVAGLKVGVPKEYFGQGLDPEVERVIGGAIKLLQDAGASIVDVSLPHTDYGVAVYYLIAPAEASSNLARYDGVRYGQRDEDATSLLDMYKKTRSAGFGEEVKRRILIGTYALSSGYYDAYYKKASRVRTLILNDYTSAFKKCDLLISPVTPTPAWKFGENSDDPLSMYLSDIMTLSANLAGIPGLSVPGGFSREGLPIGVQLQGPHFSEPRLLQAGYHLEQGLDVSPKVAPNI